MRQKILQLPMRQKQLQKSGKPSRHLWLFLVGISLFLLTACSTPFASGAASVGTTLGATTTGHIVGVISCSSLAQKDFSSVLSGATVKITSATVVAASGSTPESCKIDGVISPQIEFEIQLPTKQWNGDYFEGGCGGLCGMLAESADCQTAFSQYGEAIGYTDMGHEGNDMTTWGLNETMREDFAYLANHYVVVLAKALIKTYYGRGVSYSYFDGCSDGGREALMEAQRYPTDFNGIIAGAPAMYFSFLNSFEHGWVTHVDLDSNGNEILTSSDLTVLHNAVIAACDKLDGTVDGLIDDPYACKFDPTTIECTATQTTNCLTAQKAEIAKEIYQGPVDENGDLLYPGGGYAYGSELGWAGLATMGENIVNSVTEYLSQPGSTTTSGINVSNLQYTSAQFNSFLKAAAQYDATNADLSAFRAHGGKLILWHGLADPSIPSLGTIAYYQALVKRMGGLNATQQFARLFLFPGVFHCGNGYGPYHFDLISAITNWVERGIAPSQIIATQYSTDSTQGSPGGPPAGGGTTQATPTPTPTGSVVRTLPIYPFPEIPKYTGSGSINDASNYVAVTSRDEEHATFPWLGQFLYFQPGTN